MLLKKRRRKSKTIYYDRGHGKSKKGGELILHRLPMQHFLNGVPVQQNETLELLLTNGKWLRGFYLWSHIERTQPNLWVEVELRGPIRIGHVILTLPKDAILRRP